MRARLVDFLSGGGGRGGESKRQLAALAGQAVFGVRIEIRAPVVWRHFPLGALGGIEHALGIDARRAAHPLPDGALRDGWIQPAAELAL